MIIKRKFVVCVVFYRRTRNVDAARRSQLHSLASAYFCRKLNRFLGSAEEFSVVFSSFLQTHMSFMVLKFLFAIKYRNRL